MKFAALSLYLEKLESTSSRLEITKVITELLKKSESKETGKIVNLLLGQLAPSYEGVVFNLADKMVLRAIASAYSKDLKAVNAIYKKTGDIGKTAEQLGASKNSNLTVSKVYEILRNLAVDEGEGSVERKINALSSLLNALDPLSAKYVARIPVGKLRLGFSDKTILDALSQMATGDKSAKAQIEKAYQVVPDVATLATQIKSTGLKNLSLAPKPVIGVPVLPMLASRLNSAEEMINKMGQVAIEPKFDGLRALIHFDSSLPEDRRVKVFTRNLNNITQMFPELRNIKKHINAKSVILDAEAIGLDPKTRKMVHFQRTMQRRRKHEINQTSKDIPINFQVFDILLKDGVNLMQEPYIKRREVLINTIKKNNLIQIDEATITKDPKIIRQKHKEYLDKGLEGVIVKKVDSKYVGGRTGWRWVKMKEKEGTRGKLSDTVDVVIMGYTQGKGKRAVFGIGQFLAGVKDKDKIKSITKVGTGLTDQQFTVLEKKLKKIKITNKPKSYQVHKDLEPDFWVEPNVVVELAADELTKSPKHASGFALRFPRLINFREDKSVAQSTSLSEIKKLFNLQKNN